MLTKPHGEHKVVYLRLGSEAKLFEGTLTPWPGAPEYQGLRMRRREGYGGFRDLGLDGNEPRSGILTRYREQTSTCRADDVLTSRVMPPSTVALLLPECVSMSCL